MRQMFMVLAMSLGMGGFLVAADCTPTQKDVLKKCEIGLLPASWQDALTDVATFLASDDWEAELIALVAKTSAAEVNCLVQAVKSKNQVVLARRGQPSPVLVKQNRNADAWLEKHVTGGGK